MVRSVQSDAVSGAGDLGAAGSPEELMNTATEGILADQESALQAAAARGNPTEMRSMIATNQDELFSALDTLPQGSVTEAMKQSFVSSQISRQKETFLGASPRTLGATPTEKSLIVNGVSCILVADPSDPDNVNKMMLFPISQTAAVGTQGGPAYSSTEALWYTMQNALNTGDQTTFQQTLNAYLFLVNQKQAAIAGSDQSNYANQWAATPGLAGWTFNLGVPAGATIQNNLWLAENPGGAPANAPYPLNPLYPYAQGNASDAGLSSATDADEQIINMMIQAESKFGDLSLHCFGAFPPAAGNLPPGDPVLPGPVMDTSMSSLLHEAITSFMAYDVSNANTPPMNGTRGGFVYGGVTYYPVLTNDNWGHNTLNPSYADFGALANIYNYMTSQGSFGNSPQILQQAVIQTVRYIGVLQGPPPNGYNGALPDNPTWNEGAGPNKNGPTTVGWDSIRYLTSSAMYLFEYGKTDPFGIATWLQGSLKGMLGSVWGMLKTPNDPTSGLNNGSTLAGAALMGPLLVAATYLNSIGQLPSNMTAADIATLQTDLNAAVPPFDPTESSADWQAAYYATQLYLVNSYDAQKIAAG